MDRFNQKKREEANQPNQGVGKYGEVKSNNTATYKIPVKKRLGDFKTVQQTKKAKLIVTLSNKKIPKDDKITSTSKTHQTTTKVPKKKIGHNLEDVIPLGKSKIPSTKSIIPIYDEEFEDEWNLMQTQLPSDQDSLFAPDKIYKPGKQTIIPNKRDIGVNTDLTFKDIQKLEESQDPTRSERRQNLSN